jgi:hypothetical protein
MLALICGQAKAASDVDLTFTGTASTDFSGNVLIYETGEGPSTSFAGQPVNINLVISDQAGVQYVSYFSASWSNQTFTIPYITGWTATGSSQLGGGNPITFFSTVDLTDTGGTIDIFPSFGYVGEFDGGFNLNLSYTLPSAHSLSAPFKDSAAGGGSIQATITDDISSSVGAYDAESLGDFTVSSLSSTPVPEPAAWAIMLAGLFGLGAAVRMRENRVTRPV